jgi:hypothetical protein
MMGSALLGAALVLGSRGVSGGGPADQAAPPKEELAKLVTQDIGAVRATLAKGRLDKRSARKAKAAAFMVALYADSAGLPELRASALKVVQLIEEKKGKEAVQLAAKLAPDAKPGGKGPAVAWEKQLDFDDLMHQFSSAGLGGFGLEKELGDLIEGKDELTAAQLEAVRLLAAKMAMIGRVVDAYAAERNQGGMKTKENWLMFSAQFRKESLGLIQAARSKDQAATRAALEKVSTTCTKCHDVFR